MGVYPGDLVYPCRGQVVPADILLLKGSCLVNEAMLTGEAKLVCKQAIADDDELFGEYEQSSLLFAGSHCEEVSEEDTLGLVVATGFSTLNGRMIRLVLEPSLERARIEKDMSRFLLIMFGFGVIGQLSYVLFLAWTQQLSKVGGGEVFIHCMEILTTLVPAFLPLCLSQSNYYGMKRMESHGVNCTDHAQLNKSGSVRYACFDKTGTITSKELRLKLYFCLHPQRGTQELQPSSFGQAALEYRLIIASCHTLCQLTSPGQGWPPRR